MSDALDQLVKKHPHLDLSKNLNRSNMIRLQCGHFSDVHKPNISSNTNDDTGQLLREALHVIELNYERNGNTIGCAVAKR